MPSEVRFFVTRFAALSTCLASFSSPNKFLRSSNSALAISDGLQALVGGTRESDLLSRDQLRSLQAFDLSHGLR